MCYGGEECVSTPPLPTLTLTLTLTPPLPPLNSELLAASASCLHEIYVTGPHRR
jgi:hypothetical protein